MVYTLIFFAIVLLDQISKTIVAAYNVDVTIIENFFSFTFVYNPGAAFSMLGDKSWAQMFFIVSTCLILVGLGVYLIFTKKESKFFKISIVMVMGGAVGNLIDRIALGMVRDFIFVHIFANFNIADIFVCVGAFMLAIYILFLDDDPIFGKKKNAE